MFVGIKVLEKKIEFDKESILLALVSSEVVI